jgi:hypothetical protein
MAGQDITGRKGLALPSLLLLRFRPGPAQLGQIPFGQHQLEAGTDLIGCGQQFRVAGELGPVLGGDDGEGVVGAHLGDHLGERQRRQLVGLIDDDPPAGGGLTLGPLDDLPGQVAQEEIADPFRGRGGELALIEVAEDELPGIEPLDERQIAFGLVEHVREIGAVGDLA